MYLHLFMHEDDRNNIVTVQTTSADITVGQLEVMRRHFPSHGYYATEEL